MALFDRCGRIARRTLAPIAIGLVVAGCGGSGEPIRFGLAGALSNPIGEPMRNGARLAVEEINAAGGIDGRRIELVERDDHGDPDSAVAVAADLYEAGVVAVVGHLFSPTTLAAAPVYNGGSDPVVAISTSSSSPEVTTAGDYTFRVCPSDLAHGQALARWVREKLGFERGAVLYLNDQYGRGVRETFVLEFTRAGGQLASIDPYLGDTPEVGPLLDRIARDRGVQFIVVAGNRSDAETILREARRRGITAPVLGADGLQYIERGGEIAQGVYYTQTYLPILPSEINRRFVAAYGRKYPNGSSPSQPTAAAAAAYDVVYLLREAIKRSGTSRRAVRDALATVGRSTPAFTGAFGTIAFDAEGDVPNGQVYVVRTRGGAIELAGGR